MEDLRILFMGTPDFAVATLEMLLKNGYKVVGVVTAEDKPAGRGRKLQESSVKQYALSQGLNVLQPSNLKSGSFLEELRALNANLQIVVAFRMLPQAVWSLPKYGTFNLHASLLPDYRGAAPINWAIMNGETETGVTTFFIDGAIDTGEIILQRSIPIHRDESAGSLHDKLMRAGADLVLETVRGIQHQSIKTQSQKKQTTTKTAPKIDKDICKIDWHQPAKQVYNHIRGLSPYPTAWTPMVYGSETLPVKIYSSRAEEVSHDHMPGSIICGGKTMKIAVTDGYIYPLELQLPGKRKMTVQEMANGLQMEKWSKTL